MRVSNLAAPDRCTPAGEFKNNTFSITLEMTASELDLLASALDWQQDGMQDHLDRGDDRLPMSAEEEARWRETIARPKQLETLFKVISNVIF